jgi:general secretion pathway protein A
MLEFGLTGQAGFIVVTGEIGSGKTTLIRHFLRHEDSHATIGVISNTHADFGDILQWVCQALNVETKVDTRSARYQAFATYVAGQFTAGNQVVLIVDEAQNLSTSALEELRLMSNIDLDHDHTLQIILVGQPELMKKLQEPGLRQFAQRIAAHYHLSPLTYPESCAYINHRLNVAGTTETVFDAWAMAAVYYFADGVPRVINSICDMAMVYAYALGQTVIGIDTVFSVVRDREKNGVQALPRRSGDIARDDLIEKAIGSFEQCSRPPGTEEEARGAVAVAPAVVPAMNGNLVHVQGEAGLADRQVISVRQTELSAPAMSAVYLADDDQVPSLGQHRLGAFHWLRRHLNTPRQR